MLRWRRYLRIWPSQSERFIALSSTMELWLYSLSNRLAARFSSRHDSSYQGSDGRLRTVTALAGTSKSVYRWWRHCRDCPTDRLQSVFRHAKSHSTNSLRDVRNSSTFRQGSQLGLALKFFDFSRPIFPKFQCFVRSNLCQIWREATPQTMQYYAKCAITENKRSHNRSPRYIIP